MDIVQKDCEAMDMTLVGMSGSLYVNNFGMCFDSKSLIANERQIQRCLNSIQKWLVRTISILKIQISLHACMHVSAPLANADSDVKLYGESIPIVIQAYVFDFLQETYFLSAREVLER